MKKKALATDINVGNKAAGHGSNVPMQPNIPPMPSNTSNALKALNSVNATQSNALDSISRQAVINAIEEIRRIAENELHYGKVLTTFNIVLNSLINIINLLPLAQPLNQDSIETQSSDLISRQAALELCDWYDNPSMREDLEKLRPARFSMDTISRQAAIETVMECYDNAELFEVYEEKLRELPPAQPESDSGRWERHYSRPGVYADLYWHCSKCGYKTDYQYANVNHHYCPHCGHKYTILISDPQMRDMINQRRAIAIRIQKLAGKKQIVKIKKLEKEDESLKEQIWERGQELKKEFDGRG